VTVREPLFGSDLTVTQLLMYPDHFELGHPNRYTVTIKNIGTMTASRWFYNELYVRPETDPPPQDAYDHGWGIITYKGDALLQKQNDQGDCVKGNYQIYYLAPKSEITLCTVITVTNMMTGGVGYKVYAQVDTAYSDPLRWAWFGSNPEGYGTAPYTQERNVATFGPFAVSVPSYGVQVVPPSVTRWSPPDGRPRQTSILVNNIGNMTDTYTVTLSGGNWPITTPKSIGPVLNAQTAYLPITVTVPHGVAENDTDVFTITVTSNYTPAKTAQGTITTIAGYYHLYLPIVLKER